MKARTLMLLTLVLSACAREAPPVAIVDAGAKTAKPPPGVPARPDTAGVEGHGGIEIKGGANSGPNLMAAAINAALDAGPKLDDDAELMDLYLQAYAIKDRLPDEAAEIFEDIVKASPPGSPVHQKAARQLELLRQ